MGRTRCSGMGSLLWQASLAAAVTIFLMPADVITSCQAAYIGWVPSDTILVLRCILIRDR